MSVAYVVSQPGADSEGFAFPNDLSQFVYTRTYSRWLESESRRETWPETVARYMKFLAKERPQVDPSLLAELGEAILNFEVLPSMRALWSAGPAAERDNTCLYNCSTVVLDCLPAFSEILYILMQGTGVGFSVERRFVSKLPTVAPISGRVIPYTVEDSTEGWADAFLFGLHNWYKGHQVRYDYSGIRKRGAPLATKGGRASGPEPLAKLFRMTERTILGATGRQLKSVEAHDIACTIGQIVVVGGVRRSALISFSDPEDPDMRDAKKFRTHSPSRWAQFVERVGRRVHTRLTQLVDQQQEAGRISSWTIRAAAWTSRWAQESFPECRYMANNSAFWGGKPSPEVFDREWEALRASGSGERGFYMMPPEKRKVRKGDFRSNPCGEILLRFSEASDPWTGEGGGGSFCNLCAVVMRADDTAESLARKVRLATWLGAIQASFVHFPYLRPAWRQHCEEDRLLGVDITGQCDNIALATNEAVMLDMNRVARETAIEACQFLGINEPAAITCGKPSGNSSQFVDCASGFHPRYAAYYLRSVRVDGKDPLTALLRDSGVPLYKEVGQEHLSDEDVSVWVVRFPVKAPEGAMIRDSEAAVEMCNRYLQIMQTWCGEKGHNQSATIYVRDHEWEAVGAWLYEHFDQVTGLSFLPHSNHRYKLAPYEEITQAEYEAAMAAFPVIDYSLLSHYEQEDRGNGSQEYACVGGSCEV